MKCPNCGNHVPNNARFCNNCGFKFAHEDQQDPTAQEVTITGQDTPTNPGGNAGPQGGWSQSGGPQSGWSQSAGPQSGRPVPPSSSGSGHGSESGSDGSSKTVRTVIIVVAAVLTLAMASCAAFCASVTFSAANAAKNTKYPVTFYIGITSEYDTESSRIPVEVTGHDINGNEVDETVFLAYSGADIELAAGDYQVKALGSPIASNGTIYQIPKNTVEFEVASDLVSSTNDGGITVNKPLTFTPIDAKDMTDEQVKDAIAWARKDEKSNADVGELEKAIEQRRQSANKEDSKTK